MIDIFLTIMIIPVFRSSVYPLTLSLVIIIATSLFNLSRHSFNESDDARPLFHHLNPPQRDIQPARAVQQAEPRKYSIVLDLWLLTI